MMTNTASTGSMTVMWCRSRPEAGSLAQHSTPGTRGLVGCLVGRAGWQRQTDGEGGRPGLLAVWRVVSSTQTRIWADLLLESLDLREGWERSRAQGGRSLQLTDPRPLWFPYHLRDMSL